MLVACVILVLGVTSCNNNDFESIAPDEQKELSNAELIEQALSRIPQTRANPPFPVVMVTTKKTVTIGCTATEDMVIHWEDGAITPIIKSGIYSYTYSNDQPSHVVYLEGSNQAIVSLSISDNELIFLDVTNNTNLKQLQCSWNNLDLLDFTGCSNLSAILAGYNNLSSIDVTHLSHLEALSIYNNQLTDVDVSKNLNLKVLEINHNQITALNLTKNTVLQQIYIAGLPITTINNLPISGTSFAVFPKLMELNIAYTPFTSLDLSSNPLVESLDISRTAITQLDISNLQIRILYATDSNLTNLIYTSNNLLNAYYLRIDGTPFETFSSNLYPFITALPNISSQDLPGRLFTKSLALINPFLSFLKAKNWVVNP